MSDTTTKVGSQKVFQQKKRERKPSAKKLSLSINAEIKKEHGESESSCTQLNSVGSRKPSAAPKKRARKAVSSGKATIPKVEVKEEEEEFEPIPTTSRSSDSDFITPDMHEGKLIKIETGDMEKLRRWQIEQVVADMVQIEIWKARNVITLLNNDCTIPFIARYRREMTGGLEAEKLREVQSSYESIKLVEKKASNVIKTLDSENKLNKHLLEAFANAKTIEEVEHLYAPYKTGSKRSLAERARQLGLEESATHLLEGSVSMAQLNPESFVQPVVKGRENVQNILNGWQHIIADVIAKDREVLDCVRDFVSNAHDIMIKSTKSASAEKQDRRAEVEGKTTENFKFENYYNFSVPSKRIKAHQVLALNRGENLKVLTVKVAVSDRIKLRIINFCTSKWIMREKGKFSGRQDEERNAFINKCIQDAYTRLLEPHIGRSVRSEATKQAEKESIVVFTANLKNLLLTPPVRGQVVLGIDPGFKHGCKLAVVSKTGAVLETDVIYPHTKFHKIGNSAEKLKSLITKYQCETIALGNGTACRETERLIGDLINEGSFLPLDVKYCIVDESGVSIYSVSKEAEVEMPGIDPNMRSAVGIARRLQDPLLEYVKVEPKHLGVGMYQHDIPETMLKNALDGVVVECVSFVGVDLNVAPETMLRKIAGLNSATAKNIVAWRETNGLFINRSQLMLVKGLGPKSFEQCAGFVKILPQTCAAVSKNSLDPDPAEDEGAKGSKKRKKKGPSGPRKKGKVELSLERNLLDMTIIHPESYDVALRFLEMLSSGPNEIGEESLISKVKETERKGLQQVADKLGTHILSVQLVAEALKQPINYDFRTELSKPLFRKSLCSLETIEVGMSLTGRVTNTTHFGAFVDIGVGNDGLIHTSQMKSSILQGRNLKLGDRVEVKVISLQRERKRIGLQLVSFH